MIPAQTVDEILTTAKIDEVVGDYVNLKRRGVNMIGLCPFHNEKTPSFTVSPSKNLYKCFGCGKGGGSVNFLMEHEQFTYPEALRFLAQRYNIKIEEEQKSDEQIQRDNERQSYYLINEYAEGYFVDQLFNTDEGRNIGLSYFKHRGLLETTINTFKLGYSPKDSKAFTNQALKTGYNLDKLKQLGLTSSGGYDFYRERVIFPFHNISGKTIGFGGRILKDIKKAPKYLNSPESEIYNKRKTLYGLFQAKTAIRKKDQCILVEGYTDVLSLYQNGIHNVVASSGTSLTQEQVQLIKRFTLNVIVLYDGDQAGQNAALRGLDIFLENDVNVKLATIPDQMDPDGYIRAIGTERFEQFIEEEAADFVLNLAQNIQDTYVNDPINKSIQIKELTSSLVKIGDQLKRSLYIKECASILTIEEGTLIGEVNKGLNKVLYKKQNDLRREERQYQRAEIKGELPQTQAKPQQKEPKLNHDQYQERDIVRVLLQHGHKICTHEEDVEGSAYLHSLLGDQYLNFTNSLYKNVIEEYYTKKECGIKNLTEHFINHSDTEMQSLATAFLSSPYTYAEWAERGVELQTQRPIDENHERDIYQAVMRYYMKYYKSQESQWQAKIAECENDDQRIVLLTAYQSFKVEMKEHAEKLNTVVL
jgi:DNA primase